MNHLTRRQQAIYEFIVQQVHAQGLPPTLMEIADAFGLSSAAGVSDHLKAIERKGYIRRRPGVSRGIEVRLGTGIETPKARSVPVIGRAPGAAGVQRHGAPRLALDRRWASADSVAFEAASDELADLGILAGDLLVVDSRAAVQPGDLILGRQGDQVAVLQLGRDGMGAAPVAGRIDPSADARAYGGVVAVIRPPQPLLEPPSRRRAPTRRS